MYILFFLHILCIFNYNTFTTYLILILLILYIYYDTQSTVHLHSAAIYRSVLAPAAAQAIVNFWFVS